MLFTFMILTLFVIALLGWYLKKSLVIFPKLTGSGTTMNTCDFVSFT